MIRFKIDIFNNCVWSKHMLYHNSNGPAIVWHDGNNQSLEWHVDGNLHRLDGPAIKWSDGVNEWYINGIKYETELEYWLAVQNYDKT